MIKDTKYIIKRVIIGVLISLILSFIYACDVKAEQYIYYPTSSRMHYFDGNTDKYNSLPTTIRNNTFFYPGYENSVNSFRLYNDVNLYFTDLEYVTFSMNLIYDGDLTDNSIPRNLNIIDVPCYYTTASNSYNDGNNKKSLNIRAICLFDKNQSIPANSNMINLNTASVIVDQVSISNISFIYNNGIDLSQIISLLQTNNSYLLTNNNLLNDIKTYSNSIYTWLTDHNQLMINYDTLLRDIRANQNQNTQDIIDNQDQNTEETIQSQEVCNIIDKVNIEKDNKFLANNGTEVNDSNNLFGITKYIKINNNTKINVITSTSGTVQSLCFYDINKTIISCIENRNLTNNQLLTIPNNSSYVRFSINKSLNKPQFKICNNGNQALNDTQEETNNILTDDNVDDASNSLNDMDSKIATNSVISDLLLLPITLFQNIVNSINGSCSTFNLGSLYGTNLSLPCIDISSLIGSNLWGVIDVLLCGIFILSMRKRFVDIFENITSLKDRGNELE